MSAAKQVTELLLDLRAGKQGVAERLLESVYDELRALARGQVKRRPAGLMQPTELVHEAYLRLVDQTRVTWVDRIHFLAVGAKVMRRVLVDEARREHALKRGGRDRRVTLHDIYADGEQTVEETLVFEELLARLAALDSRQARIVELRFFGGLNMEEIAEAMNLSKRTVEGEWAMARAWLKKELKSPSAPQ